MADNSSIAFSCACGEVRGHLSPATARSGTHLICYCRDCRAAELFLDQPDPAPDGVDLFQTTPDAVHFEKGTENMRVLRLGPNGPLRWHTSCCNTSIFNTLARPGVPFVTVVVARLADAKKLGPVLAHSFVPQPDGSTKHKGAISMVWRLISRLGAARLSGRWRQTPFFDLGTGEPTAPVRVLTKDERAALKKL